MSFHLNRNWLWVSIFIFFLSACGSGGNDAQSEVVIEESMGQNTDTPADDEAADNEDNPTATTQLSDGSQVDTGLLVALGEQLYNDTNLSTPPGQSCASCHSPSTGFDDPDENSPTSLGADGISFGGRNSPTASYSAFIPESQIVTRNPPGGGPAVTELIGGLFWDGRAESLEEQAKGPFLNPIEMGNANLEEVIDKISIAAYANEFSDLLGADIFNEPALAYDYVADAIAAFERTELFSPFTSKFDQVQNGTATFTQSEARGQNLFNGQAQCDRCHDTGNNTPQMFSDFEYENIGVPSNPLLPAIMAAPGFVDLGLGAVTGNTRDNGKFRTSSLRNIAETAPYMHNGVFTTLTEVIDFYNTRDTTFGRLPEVDENVDQGGNIGELGLSESDIADLVNFLETLSDQ